MNMFDKECGIFREETNPFSSLITPPCDTFPPRLTSNIFPQPHGPFWDHAQVEICGSSKD